MNIYFISLEKIKIAKDYKLVPSILALDVQKAFDNVLQNRLLHDLRKRRVPLKVIAWIKSFLSDRSTAIRIGDYTSQIEEVKLGILQGSPVSPILYLFYNADLLDICQDIILSTSPTGFVDNITILITSTSIFKNCRNLERIYLKYLEWAKTHGSQFNAKKSELVHFTRKSNRKASIVLEGAIIAPTRTIRQLGVFLNAGLTP